MIKVRVDRTKCQGYGNCAFAAPNVFVLDRNDRPEHPELVDDSELEDIKGAIELCPTGAISIVE